VISEGLDDPVGPEAVGNPRPRTSPGRPHQRWVSRSTGSRQVCVLGRRRASWSAATMPARYRGEGTCGPAPIMRCSSSSTHRPDRPITRSTAATAPSGSEQRMVDASETRECRGYNSSVEWVAELE
jgi:hypothetical protein